MLGNSQRQDLSDAQEAQSQRAAGTTAPQVPPRPTPFGEDLDVQRPRLVIHKMVLNNFKSYAGKIEIGPFHKVSIELECLFP